MKLDSELLERFINTFVGFGNPQAPIWFIGIEEGGDRSPDLLCHRIELWDRRGGLLARLWDQWG